jgi:murein DD-endopeptidase MepM/ murein hydrolase activator NlpD
MDFSPFSHRRKTGSGENRSRMRVPERRKVEIKKYMVLAVVCIMFQAFIMQPEKAAGKIAVPHDLSIYFRAPQLPDRFCNTCEKPAKKIKKEKRIATAAKAPALPLLMNPVAGATKRSIISIYGDARDNGRKHEGIDIMAPRGTMVVAPTAGEITEVGYNILGGKVIWMKDLKAKRTYYFAHLDSQIVAKGMIVRQGDTLGTVGNTGNARRTRSHLHFGIYKKDGRTPVDYIRTREQVLTLLRN